MVNPPTVPKSTMVSIILNGHSLMLQDHVYSYGLGNRSASHTGTGANPLGSGKGCINSGAGTNARRGYGKGDSSWEITLSIPAVSPCQGRGMTIGGGNRDCTGVGRPSPPETWFIT